MPLSKKRNAERMKAKRAVQPKPLGHHLTLELYEKLMGLRGFYWRDQGVQPIPNRPDGSHR